MTRWLQKLDFLDECRQLHLGLWGCPPFLFILMGFVTITSMVLTYFLASQYVEEPEMAALMVMFVAALFLIVGSIIVKGFNEIAQANRMKSEFVSIVSHQLRSPLAIFKWTLGVLERETNRMDHKVQDAVAALSATTPPRSQANTMGKSVKTLLDTTEGMIKLVNSLLEVNKIEAQTLVLNKESFSLAELTTHILENEKSYTKTIDIELAFEQKGSMPEVRGDKIRLTMVIQNLLDNAIRYNYDHGKITITIEPLRGSLKWSIQDRGVGIARSEQKFIFQKFFRASTGMRFQTDGNGIGLYIAKAIVEAMGGKIGFSSEENKGSTFWFTIPTTKV